MARPRKPANVIEMAGKTHLSKADLEKRKNSEVKAEADNVHPPGYLNDEQATAFERIANELLRIGILSNLDCDALARYIQSSDKYQRYDALVNETLDKASDFDRAAAVVAILEKFEGLRDKAFKQCRAAASDLGLTISSRCKLVVPKPPEDKPKNKFKAMSG